MSGPEEINRRTAYVLFYERVEEGASEGIPSVADSADSSAKVAAVEENLGNERTSIPKISVNEYGQAVSSV